MNKLTRKSHRIAEAAGYAAGFAVVATTIVILTPILLIKQLPGIIREAKAEMVLDLN